jgi:uncharacterized protein YkwD
MPHTKKRTYQKKKTNKRKSSSGWQSKLHAARFIPAIAISLFATTLAWQPQAMESPIRDVLAYATNTSPAGLLSATNTQRSNNGAGSLTANAQLASAAQSKAEDMVAKNYWAHVSPDGKQPWAFITAAGYQYTSAGENLAYGFVSSGDTIIGWMNSPSHKENLLNKTFTEVGFGIANSTNFVGDGEQTVVVAMYATPKVAAATTSPSSTPAPTAVKKSTTTVPAAATPAPAPEPIIEQPVAAAPTEESIAVQPIEENIISTASARPTQIGRIQLLTSGAMAWSMTAIIALVLTIGAAWVIHRGIHIKRYALAGEHFLASHLHLDLTVLSIIYLGFVLLSGSGAVR